MPCVQGARRCRYRCRVKPEIDTDVDTEDVFSQGKSGKEACDAGGSLGASSAKPGHRRSSASNHNASPQRGSDITVTGLDRPHGWMEGGHPGRGS